MDCGTDINVQTIAGKVEINNTLSKLDLVVNSLKVNKHELLLLADRGRYLYFYSSM